MMTNEQSFEAISPDLLVARVAALKKENWRMSAISAAKTGDVLELLYSFDREYHLLSLRLELPLSALTVPSVSAHYFCAMLYENELHDLFGLQVDGMAVDFKGNLYRTAVKFPFGSTKAPQSKPAGPIVSNPSKGPETTTATSTN